MPSRFGTIFSGRGNEMTRVLVRDIFESPRRRYPVLLLGMLALLVGLWTGLLRLGWSLESLRPSLVLMHGPLMVSGFLGTLISLERAVALGRFWAFGAPILTGVGGILLILGVGTWQGPLLIAAGSLFLVAIFVAVLRIQFQAFAVVMAAGAVFWLVGNVVWLLGAPVFRVVIWWMGFLVVTISGERLELSRMLLHRPHVHRLFLGIIGVLGVGIITASVAPRSSMQLIGASLVVLAFWLLRYDVARHTVRQSGLTRYIAACLLAGYVWMIVGGILFMWNDDLVAGPAYDAVLHSVFVGFVFSMIFGHAPIIFPSVLGVPVAYRPVFYVHLGLLHASLLLRITGDLGHLYGLRQWGGMLNAVAILLFLIVTVYSVLTSESDSDL